MFIGRHDEGLVGVHHVDGEVRRIQGVGYVVGVQDKPNPAVLIDAAVRSTELRLRGIRRDDIGIADTAGDLSAVGRLTVGSKLADRSNRTTEEEVGRAGQGTGVISRDTEGVAATESGRECGRGLGKERSRALGSNSHRASIVLNQIALCRVRRW